MLTIIGRSFVLCTGAGAPKAPLCKRSLGCSAKSYSTHYTKRCIEVGPYPFDKLEFFNFFCVFNLSNHRKIVYLSSIFTVVIIAIAFHVWLRMIYWISLFKQFKSCSLCNFARSLVCAVNCKYHIF